MTTRPPTPPLFPYTTLFRSSAAEELLEVGTSLLEILLGDRQQLLGVRQDRAVLEELGAGHRPEGRLVAPPLVERRDRKSTRLNSSHGYNSYAVFCLKKKKQT